MSVYDHIKCEVPLPVHPEFQDRTFQTKFQTPPDMDYFKIKSDGQLVLMQRDYDYGAQDPELRYRMKEIGPHDYTGEIYFYDFADPHGRAKGWIEFVAMFDRGKLVTLDCFNFVAPTKEAQP